MKNEKKKKEPKIVVAMIMPEEQDPNMHKAGGGNPMKLLQDYIIHGVVKKKGSILVVDNSSRLKFIKNKIGEDAGNKIENTKIK